MRLRMSGSVPDDPEQRINMYVSCVQPSLRMLSGNRLLTSKRNPSVTRNSLIVLSQLCTLLLYGIDYF